MAEQHDLVLDNATGAAFRADLNLALRAISAKQWGPSAPSLLLPYQDWVDSTVTTKPRWKIYDGASHLILGALDTTNHLWLPVVGGGNATIASASTTDLSTIPEFGIDVSGTTTITALGTVSKGQIKRLTFTGILTLTYNGTSLILPGGANITTAAGDTCLAESLGSGNWRLFAFSFSTAKANAGLVAEATVASATTTNLGAAASNIIAISGSTTITGFGSSASTTTPLYFIRFTGALTLTHNGTSLILPGGKNITTVAGDSGVALYLGSGNWKVVDYLPVSSYPNSLGTEITVASATTTDLGAALGNIINISGTTTITAFGSNANAANPLYFIRFGGVLTLTHNGTSLILPGAASITTAAGDSAIALYLGSGNWKVVQFLPAVGYTRTDRANTYTKAQVGAYALLTSSATVTPDLSQGNNQNLVIGTTFTLANPTNMVAGQAGTIEIKQDGTGGRVITWGANYLFAGGAKPVLSTAANAVDVLSYVVNAAGTALNCSMQKAMA